MRKTFIVIDKSSCYSPTDHRMLLLVAEDGECWQVLSGIFEELQIGERISVLLTPVHDIPCFEQFNLDCQERLPNVNTRVLTKSCSLPDPNEALI